MSRQLRAARPSLARRPEHFSWSSLSLFEQCARRWMYKYILRLPDAKSVHLERGIAVHEALELALTQPEAEVRVPGETWLRAVVDAYRSFGAEAEQSYFVDRAWSVLMPDPGRIMPLGTYTMAKTDVISVRDGFFADWKTGKIYAGKHEQQARLYAAVLASVTGRLRWDCDLVYVDQGHREMLAFEWDDAADLSRELRDWDERARPLFEAVEFPKKPSALCKWKTGACPFHVSEGGPCGGREADPDAGA